MFNPDPYGWESDKTVQLTRKKHFKTVSGVLFLLKQLDYDLYHRHGYFLKWGLESKVFGFFEKRQVVHYHGSEVRGRKIHSRRTCFVSTPDLLKWVENSIWIPNPVKPEPYLSMAPRERDEKELVVGYYQPTYQRYVPAEGLAQTSTLEEKGVKIVLKPLQNMPHDKVAEYYSKIDVWVDRFGLDSYGIAAIEAAMSGKPVVAQIGEEELKQLNDCPFLNIHREAELPSQIRRLASNPNLCHELGRRAREYALKTHEWLRIAKLVIQQYETLA